MNNLQYLGIYEKAINEAIETCENALTEYSLGWVSNQMNELAMEELETFGNWGNITNSIIESYFYSTRYFLLMYSPLKDSDIDYFVNGDDSHFYINNEEIY